MKRTDIINYLIKKNNYKNYLEIGVCNKNFNFNSVEVENKVGVDPDSNAEATYVLTSDDFFKQNKQIFDIIFIDGLHIREQFLKDVENSLQFLSENGTIVCHDCLPTSFEEQLVPQASISWTGDVWRGIADLRMNNSNIILEVVDTDYGCGIIRRGMQELYLKKDNEQIDYEYFLKNRNILMNVISIQDFLNKY